MTARAIAGVFTFGIATGISVIVAWHRFWSWAYRVR
jgi:hypothetical protein